MHRTIYFHSEDLDGWLAPQNQPILPAYLPLLRALQGLSIVEEDRRHEIQIVLNSGKPPEYLEAEAVRFGGEAVISGNGAAWRCTGGATQRLAPFTPELGWMREALGLPPGVEDVVDLRLGDRSVEVAVEGKFDAQGDIVLSFFPETEPVRHRWTFTQGTDRWELAAYLTDLITARGWSLYVAEPHPDGAVDVLPMIDGPSGINGRPVGKWTVPLLARRIFPEADLRLTHAGNGGNDLDAMEEPEVLPLTAANCGRCAEVAGPRGGVVATRPAPAGAAFAECYLELARRGFYGPLSARVEAITHQYLQGTS